jgi:transcriptional regulator with XRE-family HTH domain
VKCPLETLLFSIHRGAAREVVALGLHDERPGLDYMSELRRSNPKGHQILIGQIHRPMKITYTRRKGDTPYAGLFSGPLSIEGEAEYRKQWIVDELLGLMEAQGITRGELARRMEVQPSRVTSILSGANNFTIETLVRAGRAVGADIELHFVPMKKGETKGKTAKPKVAEAPISKVAEDPTRYRAKRKGARKV